MASSRQTTVLFADVAGSTKLFETAEDPLAVEFIEQCLGKLRHATESCGGRVVKTIGGAIMALFATPDAAARAAAAMHIAVESLPAAARQCRPAVRIGFHAGPVIQRDNDVFGDTVNVASRLAEQATKGQVLTSYATTSCLSPIIRSSTRRLYPIRLKGKAEQVALCELIWRQSPDVTDLARAAALPAAANASLRLVYQGRNIVQDPEKHSVLMGRDGGCDVVISDWKASRFHCTVERRPDRFVLRDHSTNGTYVALEGGEEILLAREEYSLHRHGWITFGQAQSDASEAVEYFCE
jgi:adenylate cyclase